MQFNSVDRSLIRSRLDAAAAADYIIRELSFRGYGDDCLVLQKIDLLDLFILMEVCRDDLLQSVV